MSDPTLLLASVPEAGAAPPAPALPFGEDDLRAAVLSPSRLVDVVLGERRRLAATLAAQRSPWVLVLLLAVCVVFASLPYGCVAGWTQGGRVAVLYGGTVLLCWPSLQVFGAYLGDRASWLQSLALALVVAAVAALFTLGFAPIAWFLRATMRDGDWIDSGTTYVVLLGVGLFAGLAQAARCVAVDGGVHTPWRGLVLFGWQLLVLFVAWRMARALALVA